MYLEGSVLADSFIMGLCLLILASFVAGFIDSVAGGAGLVLVPSFILAGLPPQIALGQEKLVSTLGTLSAIFNFIRSKKIRWDLVAIGVPAALIGAYLGAQAILYLDENTAGKVIVSMMPLGLLFAFLPKRNNEGKVETPLFKKTLLFPSVALIIGFYDGFFGPGTGSLLIIALHYIMGLSLVTASATSKIFNFSSNVGAFLSFFMAGKMLFAIGIPMVIASILGNYLGSHMTIKRGDNFIRPILFGMIFLLFGTLIYKYYLAS
ncbi:sulfite exporter TauE/SafE family protein [Nitratifractor sp.]